MTRWSKDNSPYLSYTEIEGQSNVSEESAPVEGLTETDKLQKALLLERLVLGRALKELDEAKGHKSTSDHMEIAEDTTDISNPRAMRAEVKKLRVKYLLDKERINTEDLALLLLGIGKLLKRTSKQGIREKLIELRTLIAVTLWDSDGILTVKEKAFSKLVELFKFGEDDDDNDDEDGEKGSLLSLKDLSKELERLKSNLIGRRSVKLSDAKELIAATTGNENPEVDISPLLQIKI